MKNVTLDDVHVLEWVNDRISRLDDLLVRLQEMRALAVEALENHAFDIDTAVLQQEIDRLNGEVNSIHKELYGNFH